MKKPFRTAFVLLELAVVAYFLHDVAENLLKIRDMIFFPVVFLLIFASVVIASYGLAKKLIYFADRKLKR